MDFPEDFNQLELLKTHGHLIPRGASSLWTGEGVAGEEDEEDEEEEEEEEESEEWLCQKENSLRDRPEELMLWAAEKNRLSTVRSLLAADPSLARCRDDDGYTPLHRAAYGGHAHAAAALLAAGSEVEGRTVDGWTPLHSACRWGCVGVATLLLRGAGADVNARTNGGLTPLHLAAAHVTRPPADSARTLELLLSQRHLRPEMRSGNGETAAQMARRSGPHYFLFEMVEDCVNVASLPSAPPTSTLLS
ncbi:unnamed protein product [Merluccius merluccius]